MNCEEFKNQLPEMVDGGLSESLRRLMISHMESCPACSRIWADHQEIVHTVKAGVIPVPSTLHASILARLQTLPQEPSQPSSSSETSRLEPGFKVLLSAAGVIALGTSLFILSTLFRPSNPPSSSLPQSLHPARQAEPLAPSSQQPAPAFSPSQSQITSPSNERKIMVAPEDSAVHVKEKARFICSGRHDENQIMAAINLLGSRPGIVELQAGTFHCSGTLILPPGITLQGGGPDKTILQFEEPDQMVSILINQPGITLRNFSVTGHGSIRISASHTKLEGIGSRSDLPQKDPNSISRTAAFEVLGSVMPVRDVSFLNCSASGADRDGFALKCVTPALNLTNITLEGCRTIDCGLSVNGAGYLVSRVQNVTFKNCTDEGSFIGWIIENQSGQITIADSISTSNRQWALCLSNSHHLSITGFHQIDQPGASGSQSMNGNPGEAAAVSSPVTDSTFELIGQGKSKLPLINEAGDRNRYSLIQKP